MTDHARSTNVQKPLRVAFVGGGAMVHEHIRVFRDIEGVVIAGIWNRTRAKATALAKSFDIPVVARDVRNLYAETNADLVVMAVYETAINPIMKEIFAHSWAVFMEKPVGIDLADAEEIAAIAHARKARVFVGLNRRYISSTQTALADLMTDPGPRFIHVQDQQSLDDARAAGNAERLIQNLMYANSIHVVDYLRAFGRGTITSVERIIPWNPDLPGVVLGKVTFESGDIGLYEGIWHGPGPWACTVTTARRRWEMRPLEKVSYQNSGERTLNAVTAHPWDAAFKPGFRLQAEKVVESLRDADTAVTLDDAMQTMRLIHAIFAPEAGHDRLRI
jgi:predicted dehydrogenase